MVKEEILAGLKVALARGESLQKAMMTFYNAGYAKQEIEEAARMLQEPQIPQLSPTQPQQQFQQPIQTQPSQIQQPAPITQAQQNFQVPKAIQRVSSYDEKPSKLSTIMIFILVFLLLMLFGALMAIFLFKEELSQILNNLF